MLRHETPLRSGIAIGKKISGHLLQRYAAGKVQRPVTTISEKVVFRSQMVTKNGSGFMAHAGFRDPPFALTHENCFAMITFARDQHQVEELARGQGGVFGWNRSSARLIAHRYLRTRESSLFNPRNTVKTSMLNREEREKFQIDTASVMEWNKSSTQRAHHVGSQS